MTQAWGFRKDRRASRDMDLDIRVGSDKTGTRLVPTDEKPVL